MRRVLSLLAATAGVLTLGAAPAMAAGTITVTPTVTPASVTAGSHPTTVAANVTFGYSGPTAPSVSSLTLTLPTGFLAAPAAVASPCTTTELSSHSCPAGSLIGTGTATVGALAPTLNIYLMTPPTAGDIAGIGATISVSGTVAATASGAADLVDNSSGQPQLTMTLSGLPTSLGQLTQASLSLNGTIGSTPFIYEPTNCGTDTTTVSATSSDSTGTGSATFAVTGCPLGFKAPVISAAEQADAAGNAAVQTGIKLPSGGATTSAATITIPSALTANVAYAGISCPTTAPFTGCPMVGTAEAASPLVSVALPGTVYLTGTITNLGMAVVFPAPFNVTLIGKVTLSPQEVVFSNLPDIPLTDLGISFTGGTTSAFLATCATGTQTVSASFTGSGGAGAVSTSAPLNVTGCAGNTGGGGGGTTTKPPTVSSTGLSGLGAGKPTLHFKLTAGTSELKSFKLTLPHGVSFVTAKLKKALKVSGSYTYKVSGSSVTVTLKAPATKLTVSIAHAGLKVSSSVQQEAKKHKLASETVGLTATATTGTATTLSFTVKKPS